MFMGGNFFAQQLVQQAPKGFDWVMLPPLKGISQNQTADPQTYSIARQSKHPKEAMQFIDYFLSAQNLADLAQGDWLAPATGKASAQLLKQTTGVNGWQTVVGATKDLVPSPTAQVANYPQWKSEIATPAFQQYFAGKTDLPGRPNRSGSATAARLPESSGRSSRTGRPRVLHRLTTKAMATSPTTP
jgi:ABC-type glycerol-3-phosphate transport system substrate-binding protein